MLILDENFACTCLSDLLEDCNCVQMNVYVDNFIYFKKGDLPAIQVDTTIENYTDLDLSSYAIQSGENEERFTYNYKDRLQYMEKFSKDSK